MNINPSAGIDEGLPTDPQNERPIYYPDRGAPQGALTRTDYSEVIAQRIATARAARVRSQHAAAIINVAARRMAIARAIADGQLPANHPLPDYPA